jgi:cob(I)alamin adenosyltransferase
MQIYTKKGDDGKTSLAKRESISKSDIRIEVLGQLDELNAFINLLLLKLPQDYAIDLSNQLTTIQSELSSLSAFLAFAIEKSTVNEKTIMRLEDEIDSTDKIVPQIMQFSWKCNNEIAALLQVVRTICRRAERSLVKLAETSNLSPIILAYINRLSDWLFIKALETNHVSEIKTIE